MADSIKKQISKVTALSSSLDELEKKLEPLLSKPLPDTLNSLETLQQAKLQVLLPYLINDLIFIYLKTRGIDPKTHPVVAELDRVKQYFGKIKGAEESNKKRTTEVDKAAAGRFIKHAISEARRNLATAEPTANEAGPSTSVPVRVTDKMREREEYLRKIAEKSESEDADLEVINDVAEEPSGGMSKWKGKGKERMHEKVVVSRHAMTASVEVASEPTRKKKRKRPMDPFDSALGEGEDSSPVSESNDKQPKKKKNKKKSAAALIDSYEASTDSRAGSDADTSKREPASKKKNQRKNQLSAEEGTG